ncbi:MAG: class I SAM-dependent methyltransferase [Desulfovibrio sp.]|jgi:SAM-dependent methyltransferase|nr:class I SAM-dependent methyltransferase [Desulfovibrio sp.]
MLKKLYTAMQEKFLRSKKKKVNSGISVEARQAFVRHYIPTNASILEIGASYCPVFPKQYGEKYGFSVCTLDRMPTKELISYFTSKNEAKALIDRIEEVDFVWNGQKYSDIVGKKLFDIVIACDVIEHQPDIITFLLNCNSIMKANAKLFLAVPDKRRHTDFYRPCASLASIIDAFDQKRLQPTLGSVLENILVKAKLEGPEIRRSWYYLTPGKIKLIDALASKQHFERALHAIAGGGYVDAHVWTFTPHYFRYLLEELYHLGLQPFREEKFADGFGSEFFLLLSREGTGPGLSREQLLQTYMAEHNDPRKKHLQYV